MKFLIAFTVLALATGALALTEEQKQKGDEYAVECIKTTGADPKVVAGLKKGDFSTKDEATQCFAKCIFEKSGFYDTEGNFNEQVAKEKLAQGEDKVKVETAVDACKDLKGETACETAYKLYECYYIKKNAV